MRPNISSDSPSLEMTARDKKLYRHLLKNNANLRHVQELLGHKSLSTTERYLRLTIADLKEAHTKFHPREKAA